MRGGVAVIRKACCGRPHLGHTAAPNLPSRAYSGPPPTSPGSGFLHCVAPSHGLSTAEDWGVGGGNDGLGQQMKAFGLARRLAVSGDAGLERQEHQGGGCLAVHRRIGGARPQSRLGLRRGVGVRTASQYV